MCRCTVRTSHSLLTFENQMYIEGESHRDTSWHPPHKLGGSMFRHKAQWIRAMCLEMMVSWRGSSRYSLLIRMFNHDVYLCARNGAYYFRLKISSLQMCIILELLMDTNSLFITLTSTDVQKTSGLFYIERASRLSARKWVVLCKCDPEHIGHKWNIMDTSDKWAWSKLWYLTESRGRVDEAVSSGASPLSCKGWRKKCCSDNTIGTRPPGMQRDSKPKAAAWNT
jgi:hypothetical protein